MNLSASIAKCAAVLVAGFCLGTPILAQTPENGKPQAPENTTVALVDFKAVFEGYWKTRAFRDDLQEIIERAKKKAMNMALDIKAWEEGSHSAGLDSRKVEEYENAIRKTRFDLEEINIKLTRLVERKHKENQAILWKEINAAIKEIAEARDYRIVLGHGNPDEPDPLEVPSTKRSNKRSLDQGYMAPAYFHGSVDITQAVIGRLPLRPIAFDVKKIAP